MLINMPTSLYIKLIEEINFSNMASSPNETDEMQTGNTSLVLFVLVSEMTPTCDK